MLRDYDLSLGPRIRSGIIMIAYQQIIPGTVVLDEKNLNAGCQGANVSSGN